MEYVQELVLELDSNTSYTTIGVKQGDNLSRKIKVHLTHNGEDYTIPPDAQAYFRFRKPDGKAVVNTAEIKNNAIEVILTSQALAVSGRGYADITLQRNDEVLSTVSFIIIIMAAPGVVDQIVSSNEFGYLNNILSSARTTIYESEAWAVGERGGTSVVSSSIFTVTPSTASISIERYDENKFYSRTGQQDGQYGEYTFTFERASINNEYWHLEYEITDGPTIIKGNSELAYGLAEYGIEYTVTGGELPAPEDKIIVIAQRPDRTYENNAKYYSKRAREEVQSVVNLEVSAHSGPSAEVIKYQDATDAWHFDFTLPLPSLFSPDTIVHTVEPDPSGQPGQASASVTVAEGSGLDSGKVGYQFELWIPQGAKGADGSGAVSTVDNISSDSGNVQLYALSYGRAQSLSSAQKIQVCENIGAISSSEIDSIVNV